MDAHELIQRSIEAHGGLERWKRVRKLRVQARSGGLALPLRWQFGAFKSYEVTIATDRPHAEIVPYPKQPFKGIFEKDAVRILGYGGADIAERRDPRKAFQDFRHKIFWDDLDALYFGGYALWNYLTIPFLFTQPGFAFEKLRHWQESGETWQRILVRFPAEFPTHSSEQIFHIGPDGLIRRHDYTALVFGTWAKAAHYSNDYKSFNGIVLPTSRRVFPRKPNGSPRRSITLVWIDIDTVSTDENT